MDVKHQALIISRNSEFVDYYSKMLLENGFEAAIVGSFSEWNAKPYQYIFDLCYVDNRQGGFEYTQLFYQLSRFSPHSLVVNVGEPCTDTPPGGNLIFNVEGVGNNILEISFVRNAGELINRGKARSELAAMLIHDIRSPLNSLIAYIELLLNQTFGELNDGQQNFLEKAMVLGDQILDMLEDINEVYKIEQYVFTLDREPFPVTKMIDQLLINTWIQADQKNIKIKKEIPSDLPMLTADMFQLQRVIVNLIENAIKYSPENSTITIRVAVTSERLMEFRIIDDGSGIPENLLQNVFKKSFRIAEQPGNEKVTGQGLGLYICKLIVKAHGGTIRAENNELGGASFIFSLPYRR